MGQQKRLEDALTTLKETMCDLTSLEVQTYTGNLDVAVTDQVGSTRFEDILEKVLFIPPISEVALAIIRGLLPLIPLGTFI